MTPSSARPEAAFRRDVEPGHWRCALCQVPAWLPGGDRAASRHYVSAHMADRYDTPKPAGFVPLPRPDQQEAS